MKNRFYSPDFRFQKLTGKNRNQPLLRYSGSIAKLHSSTQLINETQVKVGSYVYNSKKQLGSGYSSKVYKAKKLDTQQTYAVKVIDTKNFTNSNLEMLENQIEILKSVNHPNILKCYQIIKTNSKCHIITQYCSDGDLLTFMTKNGKISEKLAFQIIQHISNGCKYLLQNGIIHRDLKPANILKCGNIWKIADFGFAIRSFNQVRTRHNVGTPLYMPPQSLINNKYSPKSDIFSLGIILFELIFNCTPWQSKTQKDLIKKMTTLPLKFPNKFRINDTSKNIIQKMCASDYNQRISKDEFLILKFNNSSSQNNSDNPEQISSGSSSLRFAKKGTVKKMQHKSIQLNSHKLMKSCQFILPTIKISSDSSQFKKLPLLSNKSVSKLQIQDYHSISHQYFPYKKQMKKKSEKYQKIKTNQILRINNQSYKPKYTKQYTQKDTQMSHILINQLHYCRFIYYIIKNIDYLLLTKQQKQKITFISFKHLLKNVKLLCDEKYVRKLSDKTFGSENIEDSIKKNSSLDNMMKQYTIRYEKEYLLMLKNMNVQIVREVNKQFPQLTSQTSFTQQLYKKMIEFLGPLIRSSNHELGTYLVRKQNKSEYLNNKQVCAIQALKNMLKYYKLVEMSRINFQDFMYFEAHSNISVMPDYKKSSCTAQTYLKLRKQIKNI